MRISTETLQSLRNYNIEPAFDRIGNARFYEAKSIFIIDEVSDPQSIRCIKVSLTSTICSNFESVDDMMNWIYAEAISGNGNHSYQD